MIQLPIGYLCESSLGKHPSSCALLSVS